LAGQADSAPCAYASAARYIDTTGLQVIVFRQADAACLPIAIRRKIQWGEAACCPAGVSEYGVIAANPNPSRRCECQSAYRVGGDNRPARAIDIAARSRQGHCASAGR
jgi:hypothetical protein